MIILCVIFFAWSFGWIHSFIPSMAKTGAVYLYGRRKTTALRQVTVTAPAEEWNDVMYFFLQMLQYTPFNGGKLGNVAQIIVVLRRFPLWFALMREKSRSLEIPISKSITRFSLNLGLMWLLQHLYEPKERSMLFTVVPRNSENCLKVRISSKMSRELWSIIMTHSQFHYLRDITLYYKHFRTAAGFEGSSLTLSGRIDHKIMSIFEKN